MKKGIVLSALLFLLVLCTVSMAAPADVSPLAGTYEGWYYANQGQTGLTLTVNEDGSTTREGVFAGGDAVMGARTVVEAVAIAKKVAESMDAYMKSLPADNTPDPYAGIPVFSTPTSDVLAKQGV